DHRVPRARARENSFGRSARGDLAAWRAVVATTVEGVPMTTAPRPSREIDGKGRTVRELLAGRKYSIDYYQREYKWQQKQLAELIDDLAAKFLESHEEG